MIELVNCWVMSLRICGDNKLPTEGLCVWVRLAVTPLAMNVSMKTSLFAAI